MRLSLLDLVILAAVVLLLVWLARHEAPRLAGRAHVMPTPTAAAQ